MVKSYGQLIEEIYKAKTNAEFKWRLWLLELRELYDKEQRAVRRYVGDDDAD